MSMEYRKTQSAIMEPDLYDGPDCDDVRPRWVAYVEKEGRTDIGEDMNLAATTFPPGTRVEISVPICPKCNDLDADYAYAMDGDGICQCGFNWNEWRDSEYS